MHESVMDNNNSSSESGQESDSMEEDVKYIDAVPADTN